MSIGLMDFIKYVEPHVEAKIYPLKYPASAPDTCATVEFMGGTPKRGTVATVYVQFTIRAIHPKDVEALAKSIIEYLDKRTNEQIGTEQLIYSEAEQMEPRYMGTDENDRSLFNLDFKLIVG